MACYFYIRVLLDKLNTLWVQVCRFIPDFLVLSVPPFNEAEHYQVKWNTNKNNYNEQ